MREVEVAVGTTSYCIRLADLAEQMVSDLQDEIEKFPAAPQDGGQNHVQATVWTNHWSMIQSLHLNKKRIWNLKIVARDLDNRVRAQSGTVSILVVILQCCLKEVT